jgi:hypothetical protein
MWFDDDQTVGNWVLWYRAAPGAEKLPGPCRFTSEAYDNVHWSNPGAGEDSSIPPTYYKGQNPYGLTGKTGPCGPLDWFAEGAPSDAPALPRNAQGVPTCCVTSLDFELCSCSSVAIPTPPIVDIVSLTVWLWLLPGDALTSVQLTLSSTVYGAGTVYFDGIVAPTSSFVVKVNGYGYDIVQITLPITPTPVPSLPRFISLQNAIVPSGNPVFWDQSDGHQTAQQTFTGPIPSETWLMENSLAGTVTDNTNGFANNFDVQGYVINLGFIVSNSF